VRAEQATAVRLQGIGPQAPRDNAASMLLVTAERNGTRPALVDRDEPISYGSLAARSRAVAATLSERGVEPGDRVVVMLRRGSDAAAAFFGTLAAGAVVAVATRT
jgi:acyl-CoA synthetase (AMP-forming)/AMP-acid ligase II